MYTTTQDKTNKEAFIRVYGTDIDELKKIAENHGFNGHMKLRKWLNEKEPEFFEEYIKFEFGNNIIIPILIELQKYFKIIPTNKEIIVAAVKRFPKSAFGGYDENGDVKTIMVHLQKIMSGQTTDGNYNSKEDKIDATILLYYFRGLIEGKHIKLKYAK